MNFPTITFLILAASPARPFLIESFESFARSKTHGDEFLTRL
jgi:hypothetical protein